jgi:hypothetical protein
MLLVFLVGFLSAVMVFMIVTMIADIVMGFNKRKEEKKLELARQEAEIFADKIAEKIKTTYNTRNEDNGGPYLGSMYK